MQEFIEPKYGIKMFTCPHCGAISSIFWYEAEIITRETMVSLTSKIMGNEYGFLGISKCSACGDIHIWLDNKMVYPIKSDVQRPHPDMPDRVKEIYTEARAVYPCSKRAAAALLRLAVQVLCKELGEEGKNINEDIGNLVKKGLSVQVQQALDSIRVIGNNAVHPGQINLNDDNEGVAAMLFSLVNIIVEQLIAQPKQIQQLYDMLPQGALESINKRDSK